VTPIQAPSAGCTEVCVSREPVGDSALPPTANLSAGPPGGRLICESLAPRDLSLRSSHSQASIARVTPEQADLVFELEPLVFVEGVYEVARRRADDWPRTLVVLRDEDAFQLGAVTAVMLRAMPDRDRSDVGVIASKRLRELLLPLSESLGLGPTEREAARERALARERQRAARPSPPAAHVVLPDLAAMRRDVVWRLSSGQVVELEVVADPFRELPTEPTPSRAEIIVASTDSILAARLEQRLGRARITRCESVDEIVSTLERHGSIRAIVCSEELAVGVGGAVARLSDPARTRALRVLVVAGPGAAGWLESFVPTSTSVRVEIEEEPVDDEALDRLVMP
jgi:hypothetical protein